MTMTLIVAFDIAFVCAGSALPRQRKTDNKRA